MTQKEIVREVRQGLRNPDGQVMFLYDERRTNWDRPQPGLFKCDVSDNGEPTNCDRYVISYEMRQDYSKTSSESFYVYEDPDNPGPENRGVVKCTATRYYGDEYDGYFPSNCRQRNLTDEISVGPKGNAMFLYTPIVVEQEEAGFFASLMGGGSDDQESNSAYYYGEPKGAMQCKVTQDGGLENCKTIQVVFEGDKDEEA